MVRVRGLSKETAKRLEEYGVHVIEYTDLGVILGTKAELEAFNKAKETRKRAKEVFKTKGGKQVFPSKILALKAQLKGKVNHFQRLNKAEALLALECLKKGDGAGIKELERVALERSLKYKKERAA